MIQSSCLLHICAPPPLCFPDDVCHVDCIFLLLFFQTLKHLVYTDSLSHLKCIYFLLTNIVSDSHLCRAIWGKSCDKINHMTILTMMRFYGSHQALWVISRWSKIFPALHPKTTKHIAQQRTRDLHFCQKQKYLLFFLH